MTRNFVVRLLDLETGRTLLFSAPLEDFHQAEALARSHPTEIMAMAMAEWETTCADDSALRLFAAHSVLSALLKAGTDTSSLEVVDVEEVTQRELDSAFARHRRAQGDLPS